MFSFLAEACEFSANIDWYLELFIIPSTLTKTTVPAAEKNRPKHDTATTMLHGGYGVLFGDVQCCVCAKHIFWNYGQKVQPWFHQTITHFPTCFWETSDVFLQNLAGL